RLIWVERERAHEELTDPVRAIQAALNHCRRVQTFELSRALQWSGHVGRFAGSMATRQQERELSRAHLASTVCRVGLSQQLDGRWRIASVKFAAPPLDGSFRIGLSRGNGSKKPPRSFGVVAAVFFEPGDIENGRVIAGIELERFLPGRPGTGVIVGWEAQANAPVGPS